jgi:type IV secretory pathway VirB2 component (pilin)
MTSSIKNNSDVNAWSVTLCFMLVAVAMLMPDLAFATTTTPDDTGNLSKTICNIVQVLQGNIARGVAAVGIIFLGFTMFMGKVSWGTAISLGIGLGAIFGARTLVGLMDPTGANACATFIS